MCFSADFTDSSSVGRTYGGRRVSDTASSETTLRRDSVPKPARIFGNQAAVAVRVRMTRP